ncbi:hypothetical protein [Streptomyces aureocirculatus]|uniref:hypothetical protein n=1 Tax=Streptomyces aureocirculatus TaxID=67275 RepID=UPI0004CAAD78|nr:hypothetical protein [Streptomyces aureocirculatus]
MPIVFEGANPVYVDKQAAARLKERPYLAVEMDDSTCCGQFPRTCVARVHHPRSAARAGAHTL